MVVRGRARHRLWRLDALQPAVLVEFFGVRGLCGLVGLVYTAAGIGALVGPPFAGVLVDAAGGYWWAIGAAGLFGLGAFLALLALPWGGAPPTATSGRSELIVHRPPVTG